MMSFKVRDLRSKEKFFLDDDYLNGWAKYLDTFATAVYISLCRHADKEQSAFPSQELIAKQHNIGERTVRNKLNLLQKFNMIKVKKERKSGKFLNSTYYLLNKSEWKNPNQRQELPTADNNTNQRHLTTFNQRQELPHKDTHKEKDTHKKALNRELENPKKGNIKVKIIYDSNKKTVKQRQITPLLRKNGIGITEKRDTPIPQKREDSIREDRIRDNTLNRELENPKKGNAINHLIGKFKQVNPSYKRLFGNKTERQAIERLVEEHGEEKVSNLIDSLPKIIYQSYAPQITTPYMLEKKLGDLLAFLARGRNKKGGVVDATKILNYN